MEKTSNFEKDFENLQRFVLENDKNGFILFEKAIPIQKPTVQLKNLLWSFYYLSHKI